MILFSAAGSGAEQTPSEPQVPGARGPGGVPVLPTEPRPLATPLLTWESLPIGASELCDLGKGQPRPGPQLPHLCNGCAESRFAILPEDT